MNQYLFTDIKLGIKHSFDVTIDEDKMQKFLDITEDTNPMHTDFSYAKSSGMKGKVVYGMLSSAFYSTLVGVYLPGKYALLHEISLQFSKPVFIGDKLKISGEVVSINDTFNQIVLKAQIINQNLQKISRAKIKIGILK
tara:strand:- start:601 stop:1017 length:417 start_codon:yes stop_codon:yes gene_type:complete